MQNIDLVIIGAGPAAMGAAVAAYDAGVTDIVLLERGTKAGGILNQCIHNGFGLHYFKEELTGPEYADRFYRELVKRNIKIMYKTMVLDINDKVVIAANEDGMQQFKAKAVILAMGCRERTRGALSIPGSRPSGIFSAGTVQYFVNMEGRIPGKEIVILGSGDIGLIMARRMTLEGAKVKLVCELMPYSSGLTRNIVQCLDDFGIPLRLNTTIVKIHGEKRLAGVTIASVEMKNGVPTPIEESNEYIPCDTLLLSVGLIPENELSLKAGITIDPITGGPLVNESMETNVPGVFACGNVLHVHDLVDYVTQESMRAGKAAAKYITEGYASGRNSLRVKPGKGVRYIVPQSLDLRRAEDKIQFFFRSDNKYKDAVVELFADDRSVKKVKKSRLSPSEMESMEVNKSDLVGADEINIIVTDMKK